jgi:hypothetical protein
MLSVHEENHVPRVISMCTKQSLEFHRNLERKSAPSTSSPSSVASAPTLEYLTKLANEAAAYAVERQILMDRVRRHGLTRRHPKP